MISSIRAELIEVDGGTLQMGSTWADVDACVSRWSDRLLSPEYGAVFRSWISKEVPRHPVEVAPLVAWRFPVRNDQFQAFLADVGGPVPESLASGLPGEHPVWGVSLEQAQAFARWLGDGWRLPTEAEWEWLASGPVPRTYPYGDEFDPTLGNTYESGIGTTTPVDAHPRGASWCGAMDLAGNVEEWTASRYAPYPGGEAVDDDLLRILGPGYPILRGGSFELGGDLARCARRHGPHPGHRFRVTGFRLVRDARRA